jgi:hypothetical protein
MNSSSHVQTKLHQALMIRPGSIMKPEPDEVICSTCKGQFASIEFFLEHYDTCKNGHELYCRSCKTWFSDKGKFDSHLPKCKQKDTQCKCGIWVRDRSALSTHRNFCKPGLTRQEKKELGEQCPKCDNWYVCLKNHLTTGGCAPIELQGPCPHCGKLMPKNSLIFHLKGDVCKEERKHFECEFCGKMFPSTGIKRHIDAFHTEPFFVCTVPLCKANVSGYPMTKLKMDIHMGFTSHAYRAKECPPRKLDSLPPYTNIPSRTQIMAFLASLSNIDALRVFVSTSDKDDASYNDDDASIENENDDLQMENNEDGSSNDEGQTILEGLLQQARSAERPMIISDKKRSMVASKNSGVFLRSMSPRFCLKMYADNCRAFTVELC